MINILGINIAQNNKKQVLELIQEFLKSDKAHFITTPNPEIILRALKDEVFFTILNKADISVPDGIGIKFASWVIGKNIKRYPGVDLVNDILKCKMPVWSADRKNVKCKIAVVNWSGGLSRKSDIKNVLDKYSIEKYLVINVDKDINTMPKEIIQFNPSILFCTFGAPFQEKFIYHNLNKIPSLRLAIGVGGAFDLLSGSTKRAPKIFRALGLEWMWRLFTHKGKDKGDRIKRFKKIYNAVFVFSKKIFIWRFVRPFQYRDNVSCILYKKENNKYFVLLVERAGEKGHWQMPQGGTDGEDLRTSGLREMREELDTDKFKFIESFPNLWKYTFPENNLHRGTPYKKGVGYKGQKQGLVVAEYLGEDKDIKISTHEHSNWKWVEIDKLLDSVYPIRRDAVKIFLEKFNNLVNGK